MFSKAKLSLLATSILMLSACGGDGAEQAGHHAPPPTAVTVLAINTVSQPLTTVLPGRSRAYKEAEVRPQVSGIVVDRSFEEGGFVEQGQSLYQIEPATYQAALKSAEASLARAKASLSNAEITVQRYRKLAASNALSKQELDSAEATYQEALAAVEEAKAAIKTASINLEYTEVKAPISGRIGKSSVTAGALVTANQSGKLATIQQLDPINIDIVQSSAQMLRLQAKMKSGSLQRSESSDVTLVLEDGTTYAHQGVLKFAENDVDETTGSVTLRAEFPNPDHQLLPGMYVRAAITIGTDPSAILVPQKAVTRNPKGEAIAMVVGADNKVESRVLTTAEAIDHQWRVTAGLAVGDQLIVEGLQKIAPGAVVTPAPLQSGTQQ